MRFATITSTLASLTALGVSGFSLYDSTLRASHLMVYVGPRADYTDPDRPEAVREVFVLPITIANDGARTGTVLAMKLKVTSPLTKSVKTFYAARFGSWGETPLKPFAPVVLAGRASFTQTVQFEPLAGETVPRIIDGDGGTYDLALTIDEVAAGETRKADPPPALTFKLNIGALDYRYFNGNGTMEMWSPDYRAAAGVTK